MKWTIVLAVFLWVNTGSGQERTQPNSPMGYLNGLHPQSVSIWSGYRSKYIFSNGANIYDKPVIQSDLFLLSECGFMADFWYSMPADADKVGENYATEMELIVGWAGKVKEYDLTLGVGYYDLYPAFSFGKTDYLLLPLEVSREFKVVPSLKVSPFLRAESYFRLDGYQPGITQPRTGLRYKWDVNSILSVAGRAMAVYDPGIIGGDEVLIGNFESTLLWKFGDHLTVEFPFVKFVEPLTRVSDGRKSEVVWGFGATYRF
jgi:hypothetical protein